MICRYFLAFCRLCFTFFKVSLEVPKFLIKKKFFFSFLATPGHKKFLGQGSDPSHSCNPPHSCSSSGPLTHSVGLGIQPMSQHSRDTTHPVKPVGTPQKFLILMKSSLSVFLLSLILRICCSIQYH